MNILKNEPMLPVGARPFWDKDVDPEEEESLHNVADSFVLLKSLKQSRERWLFHTFPKFSSKARGSRSSTMEAPNHTKQFRGKCDLEIGPHIFEGTTFSEAHYHAAPVPPSTSTVQNTSSTSQWHSNVPYGSPYSYSTPSSNFKAPVTHVPTPGAPPVTLYTPIIPSLVDPSVPAALVAQVNLAASTNPILSNLLQLAAAHRASDDQLKTLGLLIASLPVPAPDFAAISQPPSQPPPSNTNANYYRPPTQLPPPQLPPKEFDLIVEFRENMNEWWLIPRTCHPVASRSNLDIILSLCLSGTGETPSIPLQNTPNLDSESDANEAADLPVSLVIKNAPLELLETIMRWIGGEDEMKVNEEYHKSLVPLKRLYLGLQLTPGSLLTQLQTSTTQPYNMKLLKQGPITQSRRAPRQKSSTSQAKPATVNPPKSVELPSGAIIKKRSRAAQPKPIPAPIQCVFCKQTDVPLILGGRFCRPCVESGSYKTVSMAQPVAPEPTNPQPVS